MAAVPRIIPVLDIMGGRVVRAVGGDRHQYEPITCPLTGSRNAYDIAHALLEMTGTKELYIADLDAIMGRPRIDPAVTGILRMWPVATWLDAGIGRKLSVADLPALPHVRPVVGFETCFIPDQLAAALKEAGERPLAFSIDLKRGQLVGNWRNWQLEGERDALTLARRVVAMGVRTLVVLDLARVGTGTGAGTEPLLQAIRKAFPDVELIAGGGVKSQGDIDRLGAADADAVLVASALHDGMLSSRRQGS
jgi:phosphoribosylformimino-5-aminoimidazole carboxamide ribotide isomerase